MNSCAYIGILCNTSARFGKLFERCSFLLKITKPHLDHLCMSHIRVCSVKNFISVDICKKIREHNSWITKRLCVCACVLSGTCHSCCLLEIEDFCCAWYHMDTLKMIISLGLHLLKRVYAQVFIISWKTYFGYYRFMHENSNAMKYEPVARTKDISILRTVWLYCIQLWKK